MLKVVYWGKVLKKISILNRYQAGNLYWCNNLWKIDHVVVYTNRIHNSVWRWTAVVNGSVMIILWRSGHVSEDRGEWPPTHPVFRSWIHCYKFASTQFCDYQFASVPHTGKTSQRNLFSKIFSNNNWFSLLCSYSVCFKPRRNGEDVV